MYDLDHMLDGKGCRQHHQNMIRQAQRERFAREVKPAQANVNVLVPLRAILVAIINFVTR